MYGGHNTLFKGENGKSQNTERSQRCEVDPSVRNQNIQSELLGGEGGDNVK